MREKQELSALIGEIYDAALDPSLWPGALAGAARYVGGPAAALYSKDAGHKSGNLFFDDGSMERRYTELYFEKYARLDPSTTCHFFAEIGEPVATADAISYEEFLQTRFYREWARPQGLVDHVTAVLERSGTSVAMFGVFRHERDGLVDDATRQRMCLLVPHVRRAVLIGKIIELKTAEAGNFADTLDGIRAGMFLVDAGARIVHANTAGHALLAASDPLRAVGGRLAAKDPIAARMLHAIFVAAGAGDAALGAKGVAVPLVSAAGTRFVAHVLPLTSGGRRRAGSTYAAAAALFVHKASIDSPSPPEIIARTYGLTPTELRVLLAIVEVGGVPETAEALGVADSTARFHLKNLFDKTGSHRQADLVKLVASFSMPLFG